MLKSKELMIDNWVEHIGSGRKVKVLEVYTNRINIPAHPSLKVTKQMSVPLSNYKPIVITSEILGNAGFQTKDMADLGLFIFFKISNDIVINWNNGSIWIGEYDTQVSSVHQLQNLVCALSRNELPITFK